MSKKEITFSDLCEMTMIPEVGDGLRTNLLKGHLGHAARKIQRHNLADPGAKISPELRKWFKEVSPSKDLGDLVAKHYRSK